MDALSLPATVKSCLDRYQALLDQRVPQLVAAFYVHGSIALDAFDEGISDIDFIAVLSRAANHQEIGALEQVHHILSDEFPHSLLEGSYLQWHHLGHPAQEISPYPCYQDGRFHPSAQHDINPVTWWMLKNCAVVIFGLAPAMLDFKADWSDVRAYMLLNLDTYWAAFTKRPARLAYLLSDEGVQWVVLGICRLLYGLQEGTMISKRLAGEYALLRVPPRWHALIHEALDLRAGIKAPYYKSRLVRASTSVAFLKYVIAYCQRFATDLPLVSLPG
jgi:hypothetical protein